MLKSDRSLITSLR